MQLPGRGERAQRALPLIPDVRMPSNGLPKFSNCHLDRLRLRFSATAWERYFVLSWRLLDSESLRRYAPIHLFVSGAAGPPVPPTHDLRFTFCRTPPLSCREIERRYNGLPREGWPIPS